MPKQFCTDKERECEDPIANQHKEKWPLTGREAEIFAPRVTVPFIRPRLNTLIDVSCSLVVLLPVSTKLSATRSVPLDVLD
jgi:hypothetical protein